MRASRQGRTESRSTRGDGALRQRRHGPRWPIHVRLPGAGRYPIIPDADLWALAYQSAGSAKIWDGKQRLSGADAVRHVLGKLERAGEVVLEDDHDAEGRAGVRLLPPGAKSAERNALQHDLKRRRRENRRP